jgi:signal transduction histidine kinase
MKLAPIASSEYQRVLNLYELGILDTPDETEFNNIVQLACCICNTPISRISLVDQSRHWFKAKKGIDVSETTRNISICGHAIAMENEFFEVEDTLKDKRFFDNPLVLGSPNIRYYAGVQLVSKDGFKIGMLCVNDIKPNKLNEEQIFGLKVLGNHVVKLLDMMIEKNLSEEQSIKIESQNEILRKMLSIIAHDIRGPIGALKSFFTMSGSKFIPTETKQKLYDISSSQVDRTLELLNNLVDWGNLLLNGPNKEIKKVVVSDIVEDELNAILLYSTLKGNILNNLVSESFELKIEPEVLRFILRNLISNANKFTQNGKIEVYSDSNDQFDEIVVNDSGTGMTKDIIEALLKRDKIISTVGTSNEIGSGFGFRLIKDFMDKAGGKINIKSNVGEGTSVYLYFPKL